MADEVMVPLNVLLALALGIAVGILIMMFFPLQTQVLGGVAGIPRLVVQRDTQGRVVAIEEQR